MSQWRDQVRSESEPLIGSWAVYCPALVRRNPVSLLRLPIIPVDFVRIGRNTQWPGATHSVHVVFQNRETSY